MKVVKACGCAHSSYTVVVSLILISVIDNELFVQELNSDGEGCTKLL